MSFQLPSVTCCACSCDPSVIININGGGGGGGGSIPFGVDDPNVAGIIPTDPTVMSDYNQMFPDGSAIQTEWTWNPNTQTWV